MDKAPVYEIMTRENASNTLKKIIFGNFEIDKIVKDAILFAIKALEQEPTNCVKCQHFYEAEDSTGIYSHCFIHELHKAAEDAENAEVRKGIIKAIEILKGEGRK